MAVALVAAFCYALAAALQQHAAEHAGTPGGLRLLAHLVTRPRWLAGVAAIVAGGCLHVLALRLGPLVLVQPIGVSGLVFALPLAAALHGHRVVRRELLGAIAVAAGLVAVLVSVQLPTRPPTMTGRGLAVLVGITAAVVLAAAFGGRRLPTGVRAPVYAAGAGALFGVASALVRLVAVRVGDMTQLHALLGPTVILGAAATAGLLLAQSAYHVGSLASVLPAVIVADPLGAILVGQFLLGEPVGFSVAASLRRRTPYGWDAEGCEDGAGLGRAGAEEQVRAGPFGVA